MKKLLITGAGSYVGTSVEAYLKQWPESYQVSCVDMIGEGWRKESFADFDSVLHVAGIVHQAQSKNDPAQAALYERVNTRLAIETAKKAKAEGVRQFIFMSSESVYGLDSPMGRTITITTDTPLAPKDNYGRSKLEAEKGLEKLASLDFKVLILRPPMIYGKGCKGNYQKLAALAKKLPVFPYVDNRRSMLYIENLAEFIRLAVDDCAEGLYCPQDREYVNTARMVSLIAKCHGRKILVIRGFAWALKLLRPVTGMVDKAFGSLVYDHRLSDYPSKYCVTDLETAVQATEGF